MRFFYIEILTKLIKNNLSGNFAKQVRKKDRLISKFPRQVESLLWESGRSPNKVENFPRESRRVHWEVRKVARQSGKEANEVRRVTEKIKRIARESYNLYCFVAYLHYNQTAANYCSMLVLSMLFFSKIKMTVRCQ